MYNPRNKYHVHAYRQRHFQKGLCIECPRPAEPGKLKCKRCNEVHKIRSNRLNVKYIKERREKKLCTRCGHPLVKEENITCVNCGGTLSKEAHYAAHYQRFTI